MSLPVFFDTHAHLDYPDFAPDLAEVVERAAAAGIAKIISIGTDLSSSARALELSEKFPSVYAAVGWHPGDVAEAPIDLRAELKRLAAHPKVVALGETGLDYHRLPSSQPGGSPEADLAIKKRQQDIFEQHLEVAAETGLNCIIHQRDCLEETLSVMTPYFSRVKGVFHCFVGNLESAQKILKLGSLVSFTGIATFKNGETVRQTIAGLGLDQFMLETDCPFLAPVPYRGKRAEPAHVREIASVVAAVKGCTPAELSEATCQTARKFFWKLGSA